MVEKITAMLALCIIGAVMCRLISKYSREQSLMLSAAVCCIILTFVVLHLSPVTGFIDRMCDMCSLDEKYTVILFKSIGICYITQFACDICKDCGENAISTAAEISGKAAILIISLPLVEDLLGYIQRLDL